MASELNVQSKSSLVMLPISPLLATACLRVRTGDGKFVYIRVLCDSGAQMNLLSESTYQTLKLPRESLRTNVIGIDDTNIDTKGQVELDLWHHTRDEHIAKGKFVIINNFGTHPSNSFSNMAFPHIESSELADPNYNVKGPTDGIMGVSILARSLKTVIHTNAMGLMAQLTTFGFIIFGDVSAKYADSLMTINLVKSQDVFDQVKRMWEIDELHEGPIMTQEDKDCEALYQSTIVRNANRYSVTLLVKPDSELGESRSMARRRLYCLENRFKKHPEIRDRYIEFMDEYERLGHMRKADPLDPTRMHYYIPHHPVSIDRKFRVVFDVSAKTSNGKSLNEVQYVGPRLQKDLMDIVMKFRTGQFAMTADICKMFRQIEIQPHEWDLQRIVWRKTPDEPICDYWLTVVTYGMASSPYNAVRTLQQCADDNSTKFPRAAQVAKDDFYVDDLLTSTESTTDIVNLKGEVIALLRKGGFELAKWASNCQLVMDEQMKSEIVIEQESTSVLGIVWNYGSDEFQFKVQDRKQPEVITKRVITSEAARIFDPQGYAAPVTIRAKLFIQDLWRSGNNWDEPLAQQVQEQWKGFYEELKLIRQISIPRWLNTTSTSRIQIHLYCDASSKAYGAAAYVRVSTNNQWSAKLLCSKSRVAPLKIVTIPRLELCAVELGCKLLTKVMAIPMFKEATVCLWTDSEIVLHWLRKPLDQLKVFVANRVNRILQTISVNQSRHVRSEDNPADLVSRGIYTEALIDNSLWWNGPKALSKDIDEWPHWNGTTTNPEMENLIEEEAKRPAAQALNVMLTVMTPKENEIDLLESNSSHRKACRVTAYVVRFCNQAFKPIRERRGQSSLVFKVYSNPSWKSDAVSAVTTNGNSFSVPRISTTEYENAINYWIRSQQVKTFPIEYKAVSKGEQISRKSTLWTLTPRLDSNEILRICGRLGNTALSYDVKHPIILHRKCTLARRLAEDCHRELCHGGVQTCTQFLRNNYWIIGIRLLLRNVVYTCVTCTRYRQNAGQQFMADLPTVRLRPTPAFEHTGIDYAGPIVLKITRNTTVKGYIAVFVCMVYKAVHLELVSSLEADSCTAALSRFVNLRAGCVKHMYSDNGTNFVKVNRELQEAVQIWQDHDVMRYLENHGIQWHFNVPAAPHHGGLWEAAVKSTKHHLKRMGGAHLFTYEELATLLAKITACLNSRPLTPISNDPSDLQTLSPGHFIAGQPIIAPTEAYLADIPTNRLSAWQKMQKLQQDYWNRWSQEYITEQQRRNKWANSSRSFEIGDLVFIKNEVTPPSRWLMARVVKVFSDADGKVRSCEVRTERGTLVRPITRLCLLPIDTPDDTTSEVGFP